MMAMGTIGFSLESYPESWEIEESTDFYCGVQPGLYKVSGQRIDEDPIYRNPAFPFRFLQTTRHDRPFGFNRTYNGFLNFTFKDNYQMLSVELLDSAMKCQGRAELSQEANYNCSSRWFEREVPHMDAEPIVGPHGHSIDMRTNGNFLEIKRTQWMIGFLYIIPGANFGTNWMRFERVGAPLVIQSCPTHER